MAKKKWIKKAIKHHGALTAQAKKAGKSVSAYCASTEGKSTKTKRRCALAKTLKKMHKK